MEPVVIIGTGLAGYSVARELRRRDKTLPLVLVTADGGEYYSKPALSNALAHAQAPPDLVLNSAARMAEAVRGRVLTNTHITAIDCRDHLVLWDGGSLRYSRLVLAVGARCNRPPLEGDGVRDVLSVNSLDDYAIFRARLEAARSVAILGAGLVGCEFANDLASAGFDVDVFEMANRPLPNLLAAEEGARLAECLRQAGVRFHFASRVRQVVREREGLRLDFDPGHSFAADVVLSATGLAPQTGLAAMAGLRVRRGVVVDSFMRTSEPDVFALGDCVEIDGQLMPYTEPIRHAARALGATLAGTPTEVLFPPMPVALKTPACPMTIHPVRAAA